MDIDVFDEESVKKYEKNLHENIKDCAFAKIAANENDGERRDIAPKPKKDEWSVLDGSTSKPLTAVTDEKNKDTSSPCIFYDFRKYLESIPKDEFIELANHTMNGVVEINELQKQEFINIYGEDYFYQIYGFPEIPYEEDLDDGTLQGDEEAFSDEEENY
tara:strand:+ start:708 stop:1187 length:480 start_codon:yes stop_codon:yes gene_type:complete